MEEGAAKVLKSVLRRGPGPARQGQPLHVLLQHMNTNFWCSQARLWCSQTRFMVQPGPPAHQRRMRQSGTTAERACARASFHRSRFSPSACGHGGRATAGDAHCPGAGGRRQASSNETGMANQG